MLYILALQGFSLFITLAHADELNGKVINVADGDTITILTFQNQQHRIRIAGIDAPEKGQPFGIRSKQNLHHMAHGKEALWDYFIPHAHGLGALYLRSSGKPISLFQRYRLQ